jgi:hypothetical protein
MNPLIQLRKATPVFLVALACFGLSPAARALLPPPPPDGGYPNQNTAEGDFALFNLTTGSFNTANGFEALFSNTTGSQNTATGSSALFGNTTGFENTATGVNALFFNTTGFENTATGVQALFFNTTGFFNTATGFNALGSNATGQDNTATGVQALSSNIAGFNNTAIGVRALTSATSANGNTATGVGALFLDNTGQFNTANGQAALANNTSGSSNIALGVNAGRNLTTGSNNIDIGNVGFAGESNKIRIGTRTTHTDTFIAGIYGVPVVNGAQVFVNPNGRLGTMLSSDRFKEAIKPMDEASEAILALKPVTFRYKQDLDPDGIPQFGLIAEQVEKVNPNLVTRDADGKVNTVRYEAVNAMLLNEFLKEHRKVEKLEATVAQQEKDFQATVIQQQKQIEMLTAGLQKLSAQIEVSKPAQQTVLNNQ